ncbi:MAG: DUF2283 domain-containing protein [Candidatus Nitrosocosmicus sp.]|nr:DUF2283 domain-containing protein [Candidatus Nitrosocosmicus sp.]
MVSTYKSVEYDPDVDCLYVRISDKKIVNTIVVNEKFNIDVDAQNKPVGMEFLFLTSQKNNPQVAKALEGLVLTH